MTDDDIAKACEQHKELTGMLRRFSGNRMSYPRIGCDAMAKAADTIDTLAKENERLRACLNYCADDTFDGINGVEWDKWDYAAQVMDENGREEPTIEDEREGFMRLIEAALAAAAAGARGEAAKP